LDKLEKFYILTNNNNPMKTHNNENNFIKYEGKGEKPSLIFYIINKIILEISQLFK